MKYRMVGHVFFNGMACPIRENILVNNYDEALKMLKQIGYEYYMFTLYPVRKESE